MLRRPPFVLFLFLLTMSMLPPLSSAVMVGLSTEDLARSSEMVVSGEVEDVESRWSEDGKTILSRAVVTADEIIRGDAPRERVVIEYKGGEVGDIGLKVSDVSPLRKGEKVVLFLTPRTGSRGDAVYAIVGKGQGKYTVDAKRIARKSGFSIAGSREMVDYSLPVDTLIEKIRKAR